MRLDMKRYLMPLLLCTLPFAGACSGAPDGTPGAQGGTAGTDTTASAQARLDGESIFQGVFFGQGPIRQLLPEVWGDKQIAAVRDQLQSNPQDVAAKLDQQADLAKANGWSAASVARMHDSAAQIRAGHFDLNTGADQTAMRTMVSAKIRDLDPGFFDRFGAGMQSGDPVQVDKALSDGVHMLQSALEDMGGQNDVSPDNLPLPAPVVWALVYVALSVAVVVATVSIAIGVLVFGLEKNDESGRLAHQELVARLANGLAY